jgi:hypothetical protein
MTFTMKSMRPLRVVAILSNAAFIYYAVAVHILPVLVLHSVLLPLNVFRLVQIQIENPWARWPARAARRSEVFVVSMALFGFVVLAAAVASAVEHPKGNAPQTMSPQTMYWPLGFWRPR